MLYDRIVRWKWTIKDALTTKIGNQAPFIYQRTSSSDRFSENDLQRLNEEKYIEPTIMRRNRRKLRQKYLELLLNIQSNIKLLPYYKNYETQTQN